MGLFCWLKGLVMLINLQRCEYVVADCGGAEKIEGKLDYLTLGNPQQIQKIG